MVIVCCRASRIGLGSRIIHFHRLNAFSGQISLVFYIVGLFRMMVTAEPVSMMKCSFFLLYSFSTLLLFRHFSVGLCDTNHCLQLMSFF